MFCTEFLQNLKNHAQSAYHFAVRQRDDISQSIYVVDSTLIHNKSTIFVVDSVLIHDKSTIFVVDSVTWVMDGTIILQAKWVQNNQLLKTNASVPIFNGQLFLLWLHFVQQHPFM